MACSIFQPLGLALPVEAQPISPLLDTEDPSPLLPKAKKIFYRPIRGIPGSRPGVRPALPESYLQLEGGSGPWKMQLCAEKRVEGYGEHSSAMDDVFVQRLSEASLNSATIGNTASCAGSSIESDILATPLPSNAVHRFSSCFGDSAPAITPEQDRLSVSQSSKRSLPSREDDIDPFSTPKKQKSAVSGGLKPWKTPTTDRGASAFSTIGYWRARSISSGSPRDSASTLKVPPVFRVPASKPASGLSALPATEDGILDIRLPLSPSRQLASLSLNDKNTSPSKRQRSRSEIKDARATKVREKNLRIRLEDPKAKTAATALDGLFGIGKEESKAARCGYAGLGIGVDKESWKRVEDYETLLGGNIRSSVYNCGPRTSRSPRSPKSPRSTSRRRRQSSCHSTPSTVGFRSRNNSIHQSAPAIRTRKAPPPPLDLSKVLSFDLRNPIADVALAKKRSSLKRKAVPQLEVVIVGKASRVLLNPLEREMHKRAAEEAKLKIEGAEEKSVVRTTLRGILRSVRSISNLRSTDVG